MLLESFLKLINQFKLDAYINLISDEHCNKVISPLDERVKALTGFTGINGTAITGIERVFFTTEKYIEKAKKEIRGYKVIDQELISMTSWIISSKIRRIGISSKLISSKNFTKLYNTLASKNIKLVAFTDDLLDKVWNKPKQKFNNIFDLEKQKFNTFIDLKYIKTFSEFKISNSTGYNLNTIVPGEKFSKKLKKLTAQIKRNEGYLISDLSTIGWLTNLRGSDIKYTSGFYSFAYITRNKLRLFTGKQVSKSSIIYLPYDSFYSFLDKITEDKVYISGDVNFYIYSKLKNPQYSEKIILAESTKNENEVFGFKIAGIKDATALIKLFVWIENSPPVTEKEIQYKLMILKSQGKGYFSENNLPIVASGINTRKIYHEASNKLHFKNDLLVIETGSHYIHGTTSITRTICLGRPSQDMIKYYTIILKSLLRAKLIKRFSLKDKDLDQAARYYLRKIGKDNNTSIIHEVKYFGNDNDLLFNEKSGYDLLAKYNILTIGPSYYGNNIGLRLKDQVFFDQNGDIPIFTNLSFMPLQINMIDNSMLTERERIYINWYSGKVREFLSPLFDKKSREYKFLIKNTEKLTYTKQITSVEGPIYSYTSY